MRTFTFFSVMVLSTSVLSGCYRPAKMQLVPLYKPWLQNPIRGEDKRAQKGAPYVSVLRQKEVIYHILHSNVRLYLMRERTKIAQAGVDAVALLENPEFRVMGISGALSEGDVSNFSLRLRWNPPVPTVYEAKKDYARAMASVSHQTFWQEAYRLLAEARTLHTQWLSTLEHIAIAEEEVKQKKAMWAWETKRRQTGLTSTLQLTSRKLAYLQAWSSLQQMKRRASQYRLQLMGLLNVRGPCAPPPASVTASTSLPGRKEVLLQALKRAPSLAMSQAQFQAHKATLWIEKTKWIPWISYIQVSHEFGESKWMNGFTLGVGVQLPVFNLNLGRIQQQETQVKAIQTQARLQVAQIVNNVKNAYKRWRVAKAHVQQYKTQLEQTLLQSTKQAKDSRKKPGARPEDIWRIQGQIIQLKKQYAAQKAQWQLANIALEYATSAPIWKKVGVTLRFKK